ncbi:trypsin-like serine peptidase [Nonomuraea wenchangensis]
MHSRARRLAITLTAAGLTAGSLSSAAGATAPSNVVARNATTPAEQAILFWTPDRLRQATGHDGGLTGSTPPDSKRLNLPSTVGRVFFTLPRTDPRDPRNWRSCSATSVRSKYRNLVATAAHCVYDIRHNTFYDNWVFIPSYRDGKNPPYGVYAARTFNAHDGFVVTEDYDFDYAFVNVHNGVKVSWQKTGRSWRPQIQNVGRLGDNVGGQGFTWNRSARLNVFSFGYPAGGRAMKHCSGRTRPMPEAKKYNAQEHVGLACAFTAGGGPFLYGYKGASHTGYLVGVGSVAWDTDGDGRYDRISSPYFNGETYTIYKAAANRPTGNIP